MQNTYAKVKGANVYTDGAAATPHRDGVERPHPTGGARTHTLNKCDTSACAAISGTGATPTHTRKAPP